MLLTRESILQFDDLKTEILDLPEWGGQVKIRAMTSGERDEFEVKHLNKDLKDFRAYVASKCIIDDSGKQIFSNADIISLAKKSSKPLSKIFDRVTAISGITKEDIDELEKP